LLVGVVVRAEPAPGMSSDLERSLSKDDGGNLRFDNEVPRDRRELPPRLRPL
jgi:hypothetical protein